MLDIDTALRLIADERRPDPLAPVTVVVPSHVTGLQLRRRLAELGPFAAVRFETLPRLAELLGAGQLAAAGRAPLARPIGDFLAGEVARESQGALARVGDLTGFARVLRQLFRRLRRGGVRGSLDIGDDAVQGHMAEVLRLYGRFRERAAAFYDDEDLLDAAADVARERQAEVARELGDIYVVPPGAQTAAAASFLDALRSAGPAYVELETGASEPHVRLVLAPDPASEAQEVVREVITALDGGLAIHEIAVFHGADAKYGRLLREAFQSAGIPAAYMPGVPLIDRPTGRGALALAQLPERDFARTAVMDFFSIAPLRAWLPVRNGDDVPVLSSFWDKLSREAGITHGTDRWSSALTAFVAAREANLNSPVALENEARARALEFERDQASALRDVVDALAARLETLRQPQRADAFVAAFKRVVADYFDPGARALEDVYHEIDQLGTVGAVQGAFSLASFTESLHANLELATTREWSLGEGVFVADYRLAAGLRFKQTILCGAYEGALPAGPGADSLVADGDWAWLRQRFPYIEDASLRVERAREATQRAVASAGSGTLVWSSPLHEAGGVREYYPSHAMVEAARQRDPEVATASNLRRRPADPGWLRRGPSPLATQLRGPILHLPELGLRDAVALRAGGHELTGEHERWRAVSMLRARRSTRFTEWDGNLATIDEPSWLALQSAVSPTSLEHYAVCGFRYLCRSLLRLHAIEEPEERELMDAAERGVLIHEVLETFFKEQQQRGRPGPGEPWTEDDLALLVRVTEQKLAEARQRGLTGLDIYGEHEFRTIRADLAAFLEADTAFRQTTGAVPAEFEVPIPEVSIAGVTLRGFVDRIDRSLDGRKAWVIDYKTGSKWGFRDFEADPLVGGTKLQLPTYVAAGGGADEIHAAYWFITHKGDFEFVDYQPTPEGQQRFERTVGAVVEGVRGGAFPAVSGVEDEFYGGYDNCKYCDFDRICSRRRDDEIAEKLGDLGNVDLARWARVAKVARGEDSS